VAILEVTDTAGWVVGDFVSLVFSECAAADWSAFLSGDAGSLHYLPLRCRAFSGLLIWRILCRHWVLQRRSIVFGTLGTVALHLGVRPSRVGEFRSDELGYTPRWLCESAQGLKIQRVRALLFLRMLKVLE